MSGARPPFDVLLISDEAPALVERVERALAGAPAGRVAVQLRHKSASMRELWPLAEALRATTRRHGAPLLINERVDLACAVEADGVHLPVRGLPADVARTLLGPGRWVGSSCHDAAELARAAAEGADYATLAPVHVVPGKGAPLGFDGLARLCAASRLPVYALGGLGAEHGAAVRTAGARGIAVIRAVLGAADPAGELAALCAVMCSSPQI